MYPNRLNIICCNINNIIVHAQQNGTTTTSMRNIFPSYMTCNKLYYTTTSSSGCAKHLCVCVRACKFFTLILLHMIGVWRWLSLKYAAYIICFKVICLPGRKRNERRRINRERASFPIWKISI